MSIDEVVLGLDIGSASVHAAVLDLSGSIVESSSFSHFGSPHSLTMDIHDRVKMSYGLEGVSFTGIGGRLAAEANDTFFAYDTQTIPRGAQHLAPDIKYIFHIGARDPYFFEVDPDIGVVVYETGTKCGGGSGILLAKQYKRYFSHLFPVEGTDREQLEEQMRLVIGHAAQVVGSSTQDLEIGGRCGVIITSDMIHKQNAGYRIPDILSAMEGRIAMNYVGDVIRARTLNPDAKAMGTGGVAANAHIISEIGKIIGMPSENIYWEENSIGVGAIGAALLGLEHADRLRHLDSKRIYSLAEKQREKIAYGPPLSLDNVVLYEEKPLVLPDHKVDVILGFDGGSTTSKVVVVDADNVQTMYYKKYIHTEGDPEKAGKELLQGIVDAMGNLIGSVRGTGFTGSSAGLYEILFTDVSKRDRSDVLKDEITCHKNGCRLFQYETGVPVDTIFELGGQDAKFTRLDKDGLVRSAKMNLACFAGTGQTLENLAMSYGLDVKGSLQDEALKAGRVPYVDSTCAVFSEAGIADLASMGLTKQELAAGMIYAAIGGYVTKFVGNENLGEYCSAQGGPFLGKAALAMLAQLTGKSIHALPHREVMGAIGSAVAVKQRLDKAEEEGKTLESAFRGFGLIDMDFNRSSGNCSSLLGEDTCGKRDCYLDEYKIGDDRVYAGGLCPKGATDFTARGQTKDYTKVYLEQLEGSVSALSIPLDQPSSNGVVAIPRSMFFFNEQAVFFAAFYNHLGFDVKVSPESMDDIVKLGFKHSHSENCFPAKLAHGHAAYLKEALEGEDFKLLLPSFIGTQLENGSSPERLKSCPYSASINYNISANLSLENDSLMPIIRFDDPNNTLVDRFYADLRRVYGRRFSKRQVKDALGLAEVAQEGFNRRTHWIGESFLEDIENKDTYAFVGIGRGYTIFDPKASAETGSLFSQRGLEFMPAYFFDTGEIDITDIVQNMFWQQGRRIIQDALFVAEHPRLFPVLMTNYACGPDSFLFYHLARIFDTADKPFFELQTDGHSSNAQYGTRILANNEVVKERLGLA
ncbi:MAG: hypothetical protein KJ709_06425 [Nanoarchaeota archaeon]|nr:hypothetical protein [Nanoarchaeota archaeon]